MSDYRKQERLNPSRLWWWKNVLAEGLRAWR